MPSTRRTLLTGLLGLSALAGWRGSAGPLHAALTSALRLPDTSLRLERLLERELGGGETIRVRRSWEVFFERQGRGAIVTGRQTGAEVSAPPNLSAFAKLEQQRDDSAMFPLLLGENGQILSLENAARDDEDSISAALRVAEEMIARAPVTAHERERQFYYLARVHAAGSNLLNTLPPDLLFPLGLPVERSETLMLPGGLPGRFLLSYHARPHGDAPWLAHAERRVTSEVGGLVRSASEVWSLAPA